MAQSKMSTVLAVAATGLVVLNGLSFVAPSGTVPRMSTPEMLMTNDGANSTGATGAAVVLVTAAVGMLAAGARSLKVTRKALHGIKFPYAIQKDAYADLEFMNDVGYLPDGTPMNRAGNAINHPETIGPDPHTPGSPLPRAEFCNSIGYLPDGTAMNAAGNALNHPETMQPDMHMAGSPLPASHYYADVGYLVDGTDMMWAGNLSVKEGAPRPPTPASAPAPSMAAPVMGRAGGDVRHGLGFLYSIQKDAYVDLTFGNDTLQLPGKQPFLFSPATCFVRERRGLLAGWYTNEQSWQCHQPSGDDWP